MASFSVVTNIAASNAQANLYSTNVGLRQALNRVSSGLRINSSGDDAAGLAVANGYRTEIAILNQGVRNANDALSDLQIKDSALDNVAKLLDRMATLATQAASSTATTDSRTTLNNEFVDILSEITRELTVAGLTSSNSFSVFISNESTASNGAISGTISATTITSLGVNASTINNATNAGAAVSAVADAVTTLGTTQGQVGQLQNRVSYAISLASSQIVNKQAAQSRIRDANIAEESANLTRYSILNQSGLAALAQANQQTAAVLSLLR